MEAVRWFHLVAASVWVGGLITLGALVPVLRKQGVDRSALRAMARQFAKVSWAALGVSILTGAWMAVPYLGRTALNTKIGLVFVVAGLAAWHQFAAGTQSPAMRGALQGSILVLSLAIVAAAVAL